MALRLNIISPTLFNIVPPPFNSLLISKSHLSDRLWLPSVSPPSPSTSSILSNSWFSSNKFSPLFSLPSISFIDSSLPLPSSSTRVIKMEFVPSPILRQKLKQTFNVTHTIYNYCIYLLSLGHSPSLNSYRSFLLNDSDSNIFPSDVKAYFAQVPYDIRNGALSDFIQAYSTQCQLIKDGKKEHFEMHYRSKHRMFEKSIVINHKHIKQSQNGIKIFPRVWSNEFIQFKEAVPFIVHDCRMTMTNDNRFYLIIPTDITPSNKLVVRKCKMAALDPGVKIFQTVYGTDNIAHTFGENDINKLDKLSHIAFRMREGIKKYQQNGQKTYGPSKNNREKKALKKQAQKIERKIKNKISDIHRKTAKFLCNEYDTIIVPKFQTQSMVTKRNEEGEWKRNIGRETARKMMRWVRAKGSNLG